MRHRNDIYGDESAPPTGDNPAVPAATVVLLRAAPALEVLMLHKTSRVAFGGMWVFPGGRIDAGDYPPDGEVGEAARNAAVRETREEAGIVTRPEDFVWFSHWTPPASTPRRFATWFFAAPADEHRVQVDGGEIQNHAWLEPGQALDRHAQGDIDLAPPTWVTLYQLSRFTSPDQAVERLRVMDTKFYATRLGQLVDGVRVAMWHGDAGYEHGNPEAAGERHRLVLAPGGFRFENTVEIY